MTTSTRNEPLFDAADRHTRGRPRRCALLAAGIAAAFGSVPAHPQGAASDEDIARVLDAFNPYVSLALTHDSNIYRLDDDAAEIGGELADRYGTLAAGFESSIERALQRFDVAGELSRAMFSEHDDLDYTGSRFRAVWHWVNAQGDKGDLGFRHRRSLRDFANQSQLRRVRDLRMENAVFGSGDFGTSSHTKVGVRGEFADIRYSETERLDLRRTTVGGDVGYVSTPGNMIGVDAQYVKGDYIDNPNADFDEYTVGPKVLWKFSARTSIEATAGYTARDYASGARLDYDGATGRAVLTMEDDGRNRLEASIYRDLSNLGDEVLEYAVVTGIRIEPAWTLREGLDLRLVGGFEKRDFDRDPEFDSVPPPLRAERDDDVVTAGAFVDWQVHRNIRLSFGADMQRRDSTRELQDYDFRRFQVQITGQF